MGGCAIQNLVLRTSGDLFNFGPYIFGPFGNYMLFFKTS